tara:strand:+ start:2769 stop:3191 length:423 start_codon:yes stop_codon:yes gene_type:complete
MGKSKDQLEQLLENELTCFKEILYKTQQVDIIKPPQSTSSMMELLDFRDSQIVLIKKMEIERKKIKQFDISNNQKMKVATLKKEIKQIALKLVEIDAKLLDLLAMKKENIVKGLCSNTDNKGRDGFANPSSKQLIDITLE